MEIEHSDHESKDVDYVDMDGSSFLSWSTITQNMK